MMNSILDQMDRLDVIVDNKTFGKTEVEFVEEPRKKTILEKANLKEYGAGGVGPLGSLGLGGGSYGAMHPIASLGDTPPKGRHRTHKMQAAIAMSQRAKVASKRAKDPEKKKDLGQASKVYQDFINKNKKGK